MYSYHNLHFRRKSRIYDSFKESCVIVAKIVACDPCNDLKLYVVRYDDNYGVINYCLFRMRTKIKGFEGHKFRNKF